MGNWIDELLGFGNVKKRRNKKDGSSIMGKWQGGSNKEKERNFRANHVHFTNDRAIITKNGRKTKTVHKPKW